MAVKAKDRKILDPELAKRFPVKKRYLVGVSGGRDSVALLEAMLTSGYRKLVVCHLDHRLRGRASTADALFVRRLAEKHALKFEGAISDVRGFAAEHSQSIETAARALRYGFFVAVARRRRCATIFLAHHADDLVETFLFNLFRGTGGGGRTMRAVSLHQVGRTALTVVRPLLHVWRQEIEAYVGARGLKFREDASNADLDRTRNRMRHKIIPALEKEFGRSIRKAVWRAAVIAEEEGAFLEKLVLPERFQSETLPVNSLGEQPVALQRRIILNWLRDRGVVDIGFDLVESVRALLDSTEGAAKVNLPRDGHARRQAGKLFIE